MREFTKGLLLKNSAHVGSWNPFLKWDGWNFCLAGGHVNVKISGKIFVLNVIIFQIWVFPKIGVGPPNHPF